MEKISADATGEFARALRVGVFHGSSLINNELFTGRGEITVGSDDDSDVHLEGRDVPRHFPLFKCTRRGVSLRFDDHMTGLVQLEHHGLPLSLNELRRVSVLHDGVSEIELPSQAEGRVEVGGETLLFQGLRRTPHATTRGTWLALAIAGGAAIGLLLGAVIAEARVREAAAPIAIAASPASSSLLQSADAVAPERLMLGPFIVRPRDRTTRSVAPLAWTQLFGAEEPTTIVGLGGEAAAGPWDASSRNAASGELRTSSIRPVAVSTVFAGRKRQAALPRDDRGIETFHADGALTPAVVASELARRTGGLRAVYERALRRNPRLRGRAQLHFVIGRDGRVGQVEVNGVADREFGDDLASVASDWRFPEPSDGPVIVKYPFTLRPNR